MANFMNLGFMAIPGMAGTMEIPSLRGRFTMNNLVSLERQALPTDPIGITALTLTGLKAGSEVHVFDVDGTELAGTESAGTTALFNLQRYASGSPYNTIRILVASLGFEIVDITYELAGAVASIPFFQRIDRAYRNPT